MTKTSQRESYQVFYYEERRRRVLPVQLHYKRL